MENFQIGEKIDLAYDSENLKNIKVDFFLGRWVFSVSMTLLGGPFLISGLYIFILQDKRKDMIKWLKINGKKIGADFTGVEKNLSININGQTPFVIKAQWQEPLTEKIYVFQSDSLWFDPTDFIKNDKIYVLIHPQNPKKYWVDISFLPEVE